MAKVKNPVMLIVLDGWGHSDNPDHNAIHSAHTPNWDSLREKHPHTLITCSGGDVGLPDQQMGNSEVGHMHLGAGRLIDQDFSRINKAVRDGEFSNNPVLTNACKQAAGPDGCVHVLGLLSPGGVHSHERHIFALLDLARRAGSEKIVVHAFLDGRDTPPQSAAASLERLEQKCRAVGNAEIGSIQGRYFAMDRNQNWQRVALAYDLIVNAESTYSSASALSALNEAYARSEVDESVAPTLLSESSFSKRGIADGDVIVFANFRSDRARQITTALSADSFTQFERSRRPRLAAFVTMTDYGEQFSLPVAFPSFELPNTFGAVVAAHGLSQLRIAETEKYAHVTFFFNGGEERLFPGEDRVMVPSPDVATYDLCPQMSAEEVTNRLCAALESEQYDAIICNFANADMVGHTGIFDATVACIETLDTCIGAGDGLGEPHTAHTNNVVPLLFVGREATIRDSGTLADLAPTMLSLLGLEVPAEMTGQALLSVTRSSVDAA